MQNKTYEEIIISRLIENELLVDAINSVINTDIELTFTIEQYFRYIVIPRYWFSVSDEKITDYQESYSYYNEREFTINYYNTLTINIYEGIIINSHRSNVESIRGDNFKLEIKLPRETNIIFNGMDVYDYIKINGYVKETKLKINIRKIWKNQINRIGILEYMKRYVIIPEIYGEEKERMFLSCERNNMFEKIINGFIPGYTNSYIKKNTNKIDENIEMSYIDEGGHYEEKRIYFIIEGKKYFFNLNSHSNYYMEYEEFKRKEFASEGCRNPFGGSKEIKKVKNAYDKVRLTIKTVNTMYKNLDSASSNHLSRRKHDITYNKYYEELLQSGLYDMSEIKEYGYYQINKNRFPRFDFNKILISEYDNYIGFNI